MKVLFLTQVLPYPLDGGPKVRAYYTLRHLSLKHDVTLLSLVRGEECEERIEHLEQLCTRVYTVPIRRSKLRDLWCMFRSVINGEPFLICRDRFPAMTAAIRSVVLEHGPFDAIHADQLWMAPYALRASRLGPVTEAPRTVLDQHNAVFRIPERMAQTERNVLKRKILMLEARKLARYEARACRALDHVVWVSAEDRDALRSGKWSDGSGYHSTVIPISIELPARPVAVRRRQARRVTFIGGLHWPPNAEGALWFRRSVWPLIRKAAPDAVLTIIGQNPPAALRTNPSESVEIVGYVADPLSYFRETAVFVVPLMAGGGMRVKILEAWSQDLPVVSTRIGAEGIKAVAGRNLLLADTEAEFAEAVIRVLEDQRLALSLVREGRRTLELYYDWRQVYGAWDEVYGCVSSSLFLTRPA